MMTIASGVVVFRTTTMQDFFLVTSLIVFCTVIIFEEADLEGKADL
ncbi:hypothetical protein [Paenibacillus jilunlii]|uniref:Uncharacterized protein n=1 Tax=Paenibacillus jilunlii TaxID=682956 RepID=A0A1G9XMZ1_9BACL|nr:hypothetical protein [Paenibacillus jilunlii]SDM98100.1 hypothetical protein SAMN05216191_12290 [Paenibacillus jilunlii]